MVAHLRRAQKRLIFSASLQVLDLILESLSIPPSAAHCAGAVPWSSEPLAMPQVRDGDASRAAARTSDVPTIAALLSRASQAMSSRCGAAGRDHERGLPDKVPLGKSAVLDAASSVMDADALSFPIGTIMLLLNQSDEHTACPAPARGAPGKVDGSSIPRPACSSLSPDSLRSLVAHCDVSPDGAEGAFSPCALPRVGPPCVAEDEPADRRDGSWSSSAPTTVKVVRSSGGG
jgi:hypothetical protein